MKLLHKKSGLLQEAIVELVEDEDWKVIEKNDNFNFNWIKERKHIVHKIRLKIEDEILGLISIEDIPKELRIHVRLIEVNYKDRGQVKRYDYIAGCLFGFICRMAFRKGYEGYVSLFPKTELIKYYKGQYGFQQFGKNMFIELSKSEELVNKYLNT
ncbi:MAG: hypothetical protein AAFO07_30180 [Bacteroidota bacterium]